MKVKYYQLDVLYELSLKLSSVDEEFSVVEKLVDDQIEIEKIKSKKQKLREAIARKHDLKPGQNIPDEAREEFNTLQLTDVDVEIKSDFGKFAKNVKINAAEMRVMKDLKMI
jgi:hypothetical protein